MLLVTLFCRRIVIQLIMLAFDGQLISQQVDVGFFSFFLD
jgi:hypothetical protein